MTIMRELQAKVDVFAEYNGDVVGRRSLFVGQSCLNEVKMKGSIVVLVAICQINVVAPLVTKLIPG